MDVPRSLRISGKRFYDQKSLGQIECPNCRLGFTLDADPVMIRGSDFLADRCPYCGWFTLINASGPDDVVVEAFATMDQQEQRLADLSRKWKPPR